MFQTSEHFCILCFEYRRPLRPSLTLAACCDHQCVHNLVTRAVCSLLEPGIRCKATYNPEPCAQIPWHGVRNATLPSEERRGDGACEKLHGTILGLLFWITVQEAAKHFCTKLPCFSHRCETTRLNSMLVKLFWQCDLIIREMLELLNESRCCTPMVTNQYPKITRMFTNEVSNYSQTKTLGRAPFPFFKSAVVNWRWTVGSVKSSFLKAPFTYHVALLYYPLPSEDEHSISPLSGYCHVTFAFLTLGKSDFDSKLVFSEVSRKIDLSTQLAKVSTSLRIENGGDSNTRIFLTFYQIFSGG